MPRLRQQADAAEQGGSYLRISRGTNFPGRTEVRPGGMVRLLVVARDGVGRQRWSAVWRAAVMGGLLEGVGDRE